MAKYRRAATIAYAGLPMPRLVVTTPMPARREALFAWHERPGAFDRLLPPWVRGEVLHASGGIRDGGRLTFLVRRGPTRLTWDALHSGYQHGHAFADEQVRGPFARWRHVHRMLDARDPAASLLRDEVDFAVPGGRVGWALARHVLRPDLERMFVFRHLRTRTDLALLGAFERDLRAGRAARVAISGVGGGIGGALASLLRTGGHEVVRLVRRRAGEGEAMLAVGGGQDQIDKAALEGLDAIVHLGGEPVGGGRWTDEKAHAVRASRVESTRALAHAVAELARPPRVLIIASGVGLYGDRGEDELSESAGIGSGFFAEVARDWEGAAAPAREAGVRVVHLRLGVVLAARGGVVGAARGLFALGLGVCPGRGRQWWAWVGLDDVLGAILHTIVSSDLSGGVNVVAPECVRALEFCRTFAGVFDRPLAGRFPAWALRPLAGERSEAALWSTRAVPEKLRASGYRFIEPELEGALRRELGLTRAADSATEIEWS
ncbi:MAG: TIGR01777 family oxidoreductase [Planctomycetota bacterium]|nr:TIGR01777 family oxidoreductase [Planctomycetota bacterium]